VTTDLTGRGHSIATSPTWFPKWRAYGGPLAATRFPAKVLAAVDAWPSSPSAARAGINAFLGLASFEYGARLLCQNAALPDGPGTGATIIRHFHRALDDPESHEAALRVVET
jgi:hypothetical protein